VTSKGTPLNPGTIKGPSPVLLNSTSSLIMQITLLKAAERGDLQGATQRKSIKMQGGRVDRGDLVFSSGGARRGEASNGWMAVTVCNYISLIHKLNS
jgi:hypothetical protein